MILIGESPGTESPESETVRGVAGQRHAEMLLLKGMSWIALVALLPWASEASVAVKGKPFKDLSRWLSQHNEALLAEVEPGRIERALKVSTMYIGRFTYRHSFLLHVDSTTSQILSTVHGDVKPTFYILMRCCHVYDSR
jgi:predicted polyphosphate/ATP-dependent NAD kinase